MLSQSYKRVSQNPLLQSQAATFATHVKVAIIGAGAGGHAVSSQLACSGRFRAQDIVMFDPSEKHYYQPSFTMVGGGVLGNVEQTKEKEETYIVRNQRSIMYPGLGLKQEAINKIDPENNTLTTTNGEQYTYDWLIAAPGLVLRWDRILGSQEALADPESPVGSIYQLEYAYKTSRLREAFKGGKAVFMLPQMPVKCGGGPQKVMYLSEETFRKNGVREKADIHWYSTVGVMFPNCLKYSEILHGIKDKKKINTHFFHEMYKIDKDNRKAYFKDTKNNNADVVVDYDFLHIVPPQSAPDFVKPLAAANSSFIDVDIGTLRHNKFKNVFALGDAANLPTAKTAAGVMSQAPILVNNLLRCLDGQEPNAAYDGYQSCPVFVGDKKLLLIEFKYGAQPAETFSSEWQKKPNWLFYQMKKEVFPRVYFDLMPKGKWFGKDCIFKPAFL